MIPSSHWYSFHPETLLQYCTQKSRVTSLQSWYVTLFFFPLESLNTLKSVTPLLLAESSPLTDRAMGRNSDNETTLDNSTHAISNSNQNKLQENRVKYICKELSAHLKCFILAGKWVFICICSTKQCHLNTKNR